MGDGNDTVTYGGAAGTGGSVNAGLGTDTIIMTAAQAALITTAAFNTAFTGFETATLGAVAADTATAVNLAAINSVTTVNTGGNTDVLTLNGFAANGTINLTAARGDADSDIVAVITNAALTTDVVNVRLTNTTAAPITYGIVTAANVETINIASADAVAAGSAAAINVLTLVATSATSVVVTGNNGLNLTNAGNVAVRTFDASGVVGNGTAAVDTAANLAVTFLSATTTGAVSITGGAGNDTLTGVGANDTITGGAGADIIGGAAGTDVLTGGEGADVITGGAGNDTINLTETTAAIDTIVFEDRATNGIDTITGFAAGAGIDVARLLEASSTIGAGAGTGAEFDAVSVALTAGAAAYVIGAGAGALTTATAGIIEITTTLGAFGNLGLTGVVDGTELLKALSSTNVAATQLTAAGADNDFHLVAYQNGNAYLYQVVNDANVNVTAAEIHLIGVFNGITAGAFATGDFTAV
jgi:S-layer protein